MIVEVRGIQFSYGSRVALKNITMSVGEGEVVGLVGPNGSGKTTLLKCLDRILSPQKGTILLSGRDAGKMKLRDLARLLGYVPQSITRSFPSTVFDTVLLGRKPHIGWGIGSRDKEIVSDLLKSMGLEEMALRDFNELSGGERQKVVLARALAQEPEVLLLDEPTNNLDIRHQLEVLDLIVDMAKDRSLSVIIAMHDLNLAARYSDTMIMLKEGKVFAAAEPESVLTRDNVRVVYGVEAVVTDGDLGKPHLLPIKAVQ